MAFVGSSGAGKTTLVNLIPRFYEASSGAIRVDGVDIRDVTLRSLRGQIAMVTQENILFHDTVRNNICYGLSNVPQERVIQAAQAALAHDFIMELPQGYDTLIGERGTRLSGGQRQRIAIARAILKDSPISDSGRSDLGAGFRVRTVCATRAEQPDGGSHHLCDCAPLGYNSQSR